MGRAHRAVLAPPPSPAPLSNPLPRCRPAAGAGRAAEAAGPGQEAVLQRRCRPRARPLVCCPALLAHPAHHPARQESGGQNGVQDGGFGGVLGRTAASRQQRSVFPGEPPASDFSRHQNLLVAPAGESLSATALTMSARISALNIVGELLRKVGVSRCCSVSPSTNRVFDSPAADSPGDAAGGS